MSHNSDMLRAALGTVRSQVLDETGIYIEGDKKIIPERYRDDPIEYVEELADAIKALGRVTQVPRLVKYRPWDVAVMLDRMFREDFGMSLASMAKDTAITVNVPIDAYGNTVSVKQGDFRVDFLHGTLSIQPYLIPDLGQITLLEVRTALRYKQEAEAFLDLVTEEMSTRSLYKGKAVTYDDMPTFYDTTKIDPDRIVYTDDVYRQLQAEVWDRIRYRARLDADGVPFGGAVVLHGDYGNGKTLAAGLTAQVSIANGVTFIKGTPGDSPAMLMSMARLYEPSVIFLEDADVYLSVSNPEDVSEMLDTFDGLDNKGSDVLVVFTTNHVERIHEGMLRPGRLKAVIEVGDPDDKAREALVRAHLSPDVIDPDLDMGPINEAMDGYSASYVVAAIDRSKVYAYSRNSGMPPTHITTQDLVDAAHSLRSQHTLHKAAGEGTPRNRLEDALRATLVPHIVSPITGRITRSDATRIAADDLHTIISHNLKAYLTGMRTLDYEGDLNGYVAPASPFYE